MKRFLLTLTIVTTAFAAAAQSSDFIILKKKNKTVRTYYAGSNIEFVTTNGAYRNGVINKVQNDSIFMQEFVVRRIPTFVGNYILDTAGSYRFSYNYNEIKIFGSKEQKKFNVNGSGAALLGGGILLTLASGVVYLADRDKFSPALMGASAGLAGLGYLLTKSGSKGIVVGKKGYRLQYMGVGK